MDNRVISSPAISNNSPKESNLGSNERLNPMHTCIEDRSPPSNISPWYSTCYFHQRTHCEHHTLGMGSMYTDNLHSNTHTQTHTHLMDTYTNECYHNKECVVRMVVIQDVSHQHVHRSHLWVHHIQDFFRYCESTIV